MGWIDTDHDQLEEELTNIYTNHKDHKFDSATGGTSKYTPVLMENFGPKTDESTVTGILKFELDTTIVESSNGISQIKS